MSEDTSEKRVPRRGFIALAGLVGAIALGVDRLGRAKSDLTNEENLKRFLGNPELFPHTNYQGEITLSEGTKFFEEPRESKTEEVGDIATTKIGPETSMGILGRGESIKVENPFLFLREADRFTDEAWAREVKGPGGEIKKANLRRSWIIFDSRGVALPASLKSVSEYQVACVPLQNLGLDFQKLTFSEEIKFGTVIS